MTSAKDVARVLEYLSLRSDGTPIEKTRLNKLLYFAQGHALAELDRALFPNLIDAWDHGPVVAVVYTGFDKIVERAEKNGIADVRLSPDELDVIVDVWNRYRGYTAKELVDMTHEVGTPWSDAYQPTVKNTHIPLDAIKRFFTRAENSLPRVSADALPTVDALPAEEYDPDEDALWEALRNDAR